MAQIRQIVLDAVRHNKDLNSSSLDESGLLNLPLFGRGAAMDSIGLVNLVFSLEERIRNEFGLSIEIASERAMSQTKSPFRTVGTLVEFVFQLVGKVDSASSARL